ncbi:S8 family serine peptidase [Tropicimonas sp. IMCC34043]|uniref:S8 family serine peptidase n=1 Tax=Tropicimonas sp. IMCC34043 TaxID=2248760 RepID=UPI000E22C738|nr:S8 family serine peptidase [Tropicimonas sp. IMCC34043]
MSDPQTPGAEKDLFYLWHLQHIGLIDRDGPHWRAPLWYEARNKAAVTVAIIDTGIDTGHPNLCGALDGVRQIDFGPRATGVVYDPPRAAVEALGRALRDDTATPAQLQALLLSALDDGKLWAGSVGPDIEDLRALIETALAPGSDVATIRAVVAEVLSLVGPVAPAPEVLPPFDKAAALAMVATLGLASADLDATRALVEGMADAGLERLRIEDPSRYFGAHGTACAGLIAGRPVDPDATAQDFHAAIPYYGANPYARILPIATPYSHEILPTLNALIHAFVAGAEVILIPRGLPDHAERARIPASPLRTTRIESDGDETLVEADQARRSTLIAHADLFEAVLKAISKQRYVVLSAGNDARASTVSYPAAAVLREPGHDRSGGAVVVGAVNRNGAPSAYTNGRALASELLFMVSDDSTAFDLERFSRDPGSRAAGDFDPAPHLPAGTESSFSPWAPLTLDVRGSFGYAASMEADPPEEDDGIDRASIYTLFSGTSAASSLAAGVIALLVQAGRLAKTPPATLEAVKRAMKEAGLDWPGSGFDPG